MNHSDNQYKKMTETPIPKLISTLAVPTVISMLVSNIYNLADAFFVSRLGTSASGAIGITSTLSLPLLSLGLMFGHGTGSIISRALGSKDDERADRLASTAFFFAFFTGCIAGLFGILFLSPILRILGSTETVLPYAHAYGIYILIAAPFFISSYVLNNIMRYEGKAQLAMIGLTTGAVLNMVLDPIFIFGLKMNISGAGLSTAISQIISFFILLYMYISGRTKCRISHNYISLFELPQILKNGLPTLARQSMNCVSSMLLNRSAAVFGDTALAAVSIVNQICQFIVAIMIGIGQGFQPVAGFNFGAGQNKRLHQAFYFTFVLGESVLFILSIIFFFGAKDIITAFRNDSEVVRIGTTMMYFQCISLITQPYCTCANMMFQSIGKTACATLLATTRNGLYMIPAILIFSHKLGLLGIQIAQPVADLLSLFTAIPLVTNFFLKSKKEEKNKI